MIDGYSNETREGSVVDAVDAKLDIRSALNCCELSPLKAAILRGKYLYGYTLVELRHMLNDSISEKRVSQLAAAGLMTCARHLRGNCHCKNLRAWDNITDNEVD
jgi:hypothetical protein